MHDQKIHILVIGDSPTLGTGMGETLRNLFSRLLIQYPDKYHITQIGLQYTHSVWDATWNVIPTKIDQIDGGPPRFRTEDKHGYLTFCEYMETHDPDIVLVFNDLFLVKPFCEKAIKSKVIVYTNIDGHLPDIYDVDFLNKVDCIVVKSQFAFDEIKKLNKVGHPDLRIIPAGCDVDRFKPVSQEVKQAMRKDIFPTWIPSDAFVFGWIGNNTWRKQIWSVYNIIYLIRSGDYKLCRQCGTPTMLGKGFVHGSQVKDACHVCGSTELTPGVPRDHVFLMNHMVKASSYGCWNLSDLESLYDLKEGRDIFYSPTLGDHFKYKANDMPMVYQLWDSMLFLSGGEGFGMPVIESIGCGIPVVSTNYTSHGYLINESKAGKTVNGILQPEPCSCILRMVPDLCETLRTALEFVEKPKLRKSLGQNGVDYANRNSIKDVAEKWNRLFMEMVS